MITEGDVRAARGQDYWIKRYLRHGVKVVGTSNTKEGQQEIEYKDKLSFILPKIPLNMKTLDYGCGIGRYANSFQNYLGYDFVKQAVQIARARNPMRNFTTNKKDVKAFAPDMVFFATVLQHIPEKELDLVLDQFKSVRTIVIYENINKSEDKPYIWFRTKDFYKKLLDRVLKWESPVIEYQEHKPYPLYENHVLMIYSRTDGLP